MICIEIAISLVVLIDVEERKMIKLRELRISDSEKMYEFLSDPDVSKNFVFTRMPFSIETLVDFIRRSWNDRSNVHFAIVGKNDEYIGTVSLKNINHIDGNAEYAIMTGKDYWGTGSALEATNLIIEYGFKRLNLKKIYLNVLAKNLRANRFYEKYGFMGEGTFKDHIFVDGKYEDLKWYCILRVPETTITAEN